MFAKFAAGNQNHLKKLLLAAGIGLAACTQESALTSSPTTVSLAPPLGLPAVDVPADNPLTDAKVELGKKLFMDRRLSHNNTISCGMCHVPEQGFTTNELRTAVGIEGRTVRRNAPTIYNVAYHTSMFHDGRETTLEDQVWGPFLARNEMDNPSIGFIIEKIKHMPDYNGLFEAAFNGRDPNVENIGFALASYERTLLSANSRFDRWYYGKEAGALNDQERLGFKLFTGKARCATCHLIGDTHALFTDHLFHNTGIGWERSMGKKSTAQRVQLAPGIHVEVERSIIQSFSETPQNDVGRFEVTLNPADRWKYKTPILRNLVLTAPYMHDGSLDTLEEVVEFYDKGGINNPEKDPLVGKLQLTGEEKQALVAFLKTLTGDNVDSLVKQARAALSDFPKPDNSFLDPH
jgi:cytochrome c peroxidase